MISFLPLWSAWKAACYWSAFLFLSSLELRCRPGATQETQARDVRVRSACRSTCLQDGDSRGRLTGSTTSKLWCLSSFPLKGGSTDEPCRLGRLGSVCRLCRRRPVEAQPSPPQPSPTDPTRPSPAQTPSMESKLHKKHLLKTLAQNLAKNLLLKALAHNLCVRTRRHAASIDTKLQPSCLTPSIHRIGFVCIFRTCGG